MKSDCRPYQWSSGLITSERAIVIFLAEFLGLPCQVPGFLIVSHASGEFLWTLPLRAGKPAWTEPALRACSWSGSTLRTEPATTPSAPAPAAPTACCGQVTMPHKMNFHVDTHGAVQRGQYAQRRNTFIHLQYRDNL